MPSQRVLVTDYAWPDLSIERAILEAAEIEVIEASDSKLDTLRDLASGVDAILACWAPVPAEVIDAAPDCRIVSRMGIGLENIDVAHCTHRKIPVTNVPDYCQTEVAEHALALMFSLARSISLHHRQTKQGIYDLDAGLPLLRMEGRTLGVLGYGRIGQTLARKASALGIKVITCSSQDELGVAQRRNRDELLAEADFVSLHLPFTQGLRHTIGKRELQQMKSSSFLINTARGGLVDHDALEWAVETGQIAGAGLDVHDPEPPLLDRPLYQHPRVIVTPHSAFVSELSVNELRQRSAQQVVDRLQGRTPENVVNPDVL